MSRGAAELIVVAPQELAAGFRLAGARTRTAADGTEAARILEELVADHEEGVVAVYEPFLAGLDPQRRARLERSVRPVVVALPPGREERRGEQLRARLAERLQQAIGYRITFGEEER